MTEASVISKSLCLLFKPVFSAVCLSQSDRSVASKSTVCVCMSVCVCVCVFRIFCFVYISICSFGGVYVSVCAFVCHKCG